MKGVVIANCGTMGLNWERMSLSGYVEALDARAQSESDASGGKDIGGLQRFMAAHGVMSNE